MVRNFAIILLAAASIFAETTTWSPIGESTDPEVAGNWSDGVPSVNDTAILDATSAINCIATKGWKWGGVIRREGHTGLFSDGGFACTTTTYICSLSTIGNLTLTGKLFHEAKAPLIITAGAGTVTSTGWDLYVLDSCNITVRSGLQIDTFSIAYTGKTNYVSGINCRIPLFNGGTISLSGAITVNSTNSFVFDQNNTTIIGGSGISFENPSPGIKYTLGRIKTTANNGISAAVTAWGTPADTIIFNDTLTHGATGTGSPRFYKTGTSKAFIIFNGPYLSTKLFSLRTGSTNATDTVFYDFGNHNHVIGGTFDDSSYNTGISKFITSGNPTHTVHGSLKIGSNTITDSCVYLVDTAGNIRISAPIWDLKLQPTVNRDSICDSMSQIHNLYLSGKVKGLSFGLQSTGDSILFAGSDTIFGRQASPRWLDFTNKVLVSLTNTGTMLIDSTKWKFRNGGDFRLDKNLAVGRVAISPAKKLRVTGGKRLTITNNSPYDWSGTTVRDTLTALGEGIDTIELANRQVDSMLYISNTHFLGDSMICTTNCIDGEGNSGHITFTSGAPTTYYKLTVTRNPVAGGTVAFTPADSVPSGDTIKVVVTPTNSKWHVKSYAGDTTVTDADTVRVHMTSAKAVTVNFACVDIYSVEPDSQYYDSLWYILGNFTGQTSLESMTFADSTVTAEWVHTTSDTDTIAIAMPHFDVGWVGDTGILSDGTVADTIIGDSIYCRGDPIPSVTQFTLTMSDDGHGSTVPATGDTTVDSAATVAISASPDAGYAFDKWTVLAGTPTFNGDSTTVTLDENASIRANFVVKQFNVTFKTDGNGTINPTGVHAYDSGASTAISASPSAGYVFSHYSIEDGDCDFDVDSTHFITTGTCTIQANFTAKQFTVTFSDDGHGTPDPTGAHDYDSGAVVPISQQPDAGYNFDKWVLTGDAEFNEDSTSIIVTGTAGIEATYVVKQFILIMNAGANGTTVPANGDTLVDSGGVVTISCTPDDSCHVFDVWEIVSGELDLGVDSSTVTVNGDGTLRATYTAGAGSVGPISYADSPDTVTVGVAITPITVTNGGCPLDSAKVTTGTLNHGLAIDKATGTISGTPTAAGSSTVTVTAYNNAGASTATADVTIVVTSSATRKRGGFGWGNRWNTLRSW